MKTQWIFPVLVVGMISLLSFSVNAGRDLSHEEAYELTRKGEIMSLESILEKYPIIMQGRLLDVELEADQEGLLYELEILGSDGIIREYEVNAASGKIQKQEIED